MSIGDTLAEARSQAGLTVSQVSQRTCIRETIIRGIERGDYSACGGDFYARGHIRSISRVVGIDPEPLIREYDTVQGAPQAISAADVFEPSTPIKIRERRRPNWTAAMIAVLVVLVGLAVYHEVTKSHGPSTAVSASQRRGSASHHPKQTPPPASPPAKAASHRHARSYAHEVVIHLAAQEDCWVQLTSTVTGQTIYEGVVYAGTAMHWTERQAVTMDLGNPGGVTLTVNGKSPVPADSTNQPITLSLGPGQQTVG